MKNNKASKVTKSEVARPSRANRLKKASKLTAASPTSEEVSAATPAVEEVSVLSVAEVQSIPEAIVVTGPAAGHEIITEVVSVETPVAAPALGRGDYFAPSAPHRQHLAEVGERVKKICGVLDLRLAKAEYLSPTKGNKYIFTFGDFTREYPATETPNLYDAKAKGWEDYLVDYLAKNPPAETPAVETPATDTTVVEDIQAEVDADEVEAAIGNEEPAEEPASEASESSEAAAE